MVWTSFVQMERQATQPAAVPSGRKRRRVSNKKPKEPVLDMKTTRELEMAQIGLPRDEAEALEKKFMADLLDKRSAQPPTSELVIALNALPKADTLTPLPTPSPTDPSVNELMEDTLKEYKEECVEEGQSEPMTAMEWDDLDQMDTQLNQLLYEACPFHPHQFLECVNPRANFGPLRFKCPQEGCPVYLFEDTREVMMEALKKDTHPQVQARVERGELSCKCGFVPKMKLSRTAKNYNKVFFSCGSFIMRAKPCGYFQWLHGPLWRPREQAQPTLRQWVPDTPPELQHRLQHEKPRPWGLHATERFDPAIEKIRRDPWMNQFGESVKAQENAFEKRRHFHKNFGSSVLF